MWGDGSGSSVMLVTPPSCTRKETEGASVVVPEQCFAMRLLSAAAKQKMCGPESCFGAEEETSPQDRRQLRAEDETENMRELEERPISIVPSNPGGDLTTGFDVCKEYGYEYDDSARGDGKHDDDEEEEDKDEDSYSINHQLGESREHAFNGQTTLPIATKIMVTTRTGEQVPFAYMLGRTYHPILDHDKRREEEAALFWFTYRCDFPEIVPYRITSDAGWGCMLRSAQMLLAQTLRMHFQSRDYMPSKSIDYRRKDRFYRNILTWFADFPSANDSLYSLHNMVAAGLSKYETLPGEWYGPGTACHVLKDLVARHERLNSDMFRVHVASEGTVYRDAVRALLTRDGKKRALKEQEEEQEQGTDAHEVVWVEPEHPLDPSIPTQSSLAEKEEEMLRNLQWDTPLLLLVPLRLGLAKFNQEYEKILARVFSLPQSVGVLGGRPRGARWFYGAFADASKVLGLDPHTVQPAPRRQKGSKNKATVNISDEYCLSVHTTYPEAYPISRLDPSVALGFYCRDKADFEQLEASLVQLRYSIDAESPPPDIFTFADSPPDYLSSAMDEMLLDGSQDDLDCDLTGAGNNNNNAADDDNSDDDEYVLL